MTVTTTTARWQYVGTGVATVFSYDNIVWAATDLKVYVDETLKANGVDYTVSGVGVAAGGNVTFTAAPANGAEIEIVSRIPYQRTIDYATETDFDEAGTEAAFDRGTRFQHQDEDRHDRSLHLAEGERVTTSSAWGELPAKADRANKVLAFDADGEPTATTNTTATDFDDQVTLNASFEGFTWVMGVTPDETTRRCLLLYQDSTSIPGVLALASRNVAGSSHGGIWAYGANDAADVIRMGRIDFRTVDDTLNNEETAMRFVLREAGTETEKLQLTSSILGPVTNEGLALGGTASQFAAVRSDRYLADNIQLYPRTIRDESTVTYTTVATDVDTVLRSTAASPPTWTLDVTKFEVGKGITIRQTNANTMTVNLSSGTLNGSPTWAQHAEVHYRCVDATASSEVFDVIQIQ